MTVISDILDTIGGPDPTSPVIFSVATVRETADGTGIVTTSTIRLTADATGNLTTPDLDPGDATVAINGRVYPITIPDSPTPVRLWPLIQAQLPISGADEAAAVRDGGGVARIQVITQAAYNALTTPDPETLYIING